jgi:hypothetical protein
VRPAHTITNPLHGKKVDKLITVTPYQIVANNRAGGGRSLTALSEQADARR